MSVMTKDRGVPSRRDRILEVAADVFAERGFVGAPLSEIAQRCNLTKPALYYHFDSKEGILLALINPLLQTCEALFAQYPDALPTHKERMEFLNAYTEVLMENAAAVRVLTADGVLWRSPVFEGRMVEHYDRVMRLAAGPDPSTEARARAYVAVGSLIRGMTGELFVGGPLGDAPVADQRAALVRVVSEVLDEDS